MQPTKYLALAGKSSHSYISARAGEHHLGLFVYKITGSRTVPPRVLQNLVLFCLTAGDFQWFLPVLPRFVLFSYCTCLYYFLHHDEVLGSIPDELRKRSFCDRVQYVAFMPSYAGYVHSINFLCCEYIKVMCTLFLSNFGASNSSGVKILVSFKGAYEKDRTHMSFSF